MCVLRDLYYHSQCISKLSFSKKLLQSVAEETCLCFWAFKVGRQNCKKALKDYQPSSDLDCVLTARWLQYKLQQTKWAGLWTLDSTSKQISPSEDKLSTSCIEKVLHKDRNKAKGNTQETKFRHSMKCWRSCIQIKRKKKKSNTLILLFSLL